MGVCCEAETQGVPPPHAQPRKQPISEAKPVQEKAKKSPSHSHKSSHSSSDSEKKKYFDSGPEPMPVATVLEADAPTSPTTKGAAAMQSALGQKLLQKVEQAQRETEATEQAKKAKSRSSSPSSSDEEKPRAGAALLGAMGQAMKEKVEAAQEEAAEEAVAPEQTAGAAAMLGALGAKLQEQVEEAARSRKSSSDKSSSDKEQPSEGAKAMLGALGAQLKEQVEEAVEEAQEEAQEATEEAAEEAQEAAEEAQEAAEEAQEAAEEAQEAAEEAAEEAAQAAEEAAEAAEEAEEAAEEAQEAAEEAEKAAEEKAKSSSSSASSSDEEPVPPRPIIRAQHFNQTFKRRNPDLERKEFIAYGVDSPMMNDEPDYFERVECESSVFQRQVLELKNICWMNPWAAAESIPKRWESVDVALYHMYHDSFNFSNCQIVVSAAPQSKLLDGDEDCWEQIGEVEFPSGDGQHTNQIIREQIGTFAAPDEIRDQGRYCIKVQLRREGGDWISGWSFEGIGVTRSD